MIPEINLADLPFKIMFSEITVPHKLHLPDSTECDFDHFLKMKFEVMSHYAVAIAEAGAEQDLQGGI